MIAPNVKKAYSYHIADSTGVLTLGFLTIDIIFILKMPESNIVLLAISVISTIACGILTVAGVMYPIKMASVFQKLGFSILEYHHHPLWWNLIDNDEDDD